MLVGQGVARIDAIRQIGVVEQTYYRWRKQYDGMGTAELKHHPFSGTLSDMRIGAKRIAWETPIANEGNQQRQM